MLNIAVLVSGGGSNLQALFDAEQRGENPNGHIALVVSSNPAAYALERAKQHGVQAIVLSRKLCGGASGFDEALLNTLQSHQIDLVVLAGFLSIVGTRVLHAYERRILNVHPALIPSFCGDGFYGLHVHEAALQRGVKITGATVHFVNEITDGGEIVLQKAVEVHLNDTPQTLQRRVMEEAEWVLLPRAVTLFCNGKL